ncbi:hypothetical protein Tco_1154262 [Tanacetum coccineum]
MTTPSPSPPISLSPPSAGESLARIASTQALIDAVTAALPSPPLPPLPPSLYIPPPVDRRDDIPESEQPPRKRLYLSTLGSRYEVGESSTARPTRGQGIDYGFVSTVDAEERRQGIRDVGVTELAELHEHDTHDLYALLEDAQDRDSMDGGGGGLCFPRGLGSLDWLSHATHQELQTHRDHVYAHETHLQASDTATAVGYSHSDTASETLQVIRDMRREMSDMQAELLALREQHRRARQPGTEARIPDHQDASWDADSHI